jgi:hypothetical protein
VTGLGCLGYGEDKEEVLEGIAKGEMGVDGAGGRGRRKTRLSLLPYSFFGYVAVLLLHTHGVSS